MEPPLGPQKTSREGKRRRSEDPEGSAEKGLARPGDALPADVLEAKRQPNLKKLRRDEQSREVLNVQRQLERNAHRLVGKTQELEHQVQAERQQLMQQVEAKGYCICKPPSSIFPHYCRTMVICIRSEGGLSRRNHTTKSRGQRLFSRTCQVCKHNLGRRRFSVRLGATGGGSEGQDLLVAALRVKNAEEDPTDEDRTSNQTTPDGIPDYGKSPKEPDLDNEQDKNEPKVCRGGGCRGQP